MSPLTVIVVVLALVVLYLFAWPLPATPRAWEPPEAPDMTGPYEPNHALTGAETILDGIGQGPEAVVFDDEGRLYTGFEDGRIMRSDPGGENPVVFADTDGRPLGMAFDPDGNLLVADADRGLLAVDSEGRIDVLATEAGGVPFGFTNDVDVTRDGTIYFTDSSDRFGYGEVMTDIIEHGGRGRFIRYDPAADDVEVLMDGLQFANGVALSEDESYALVCETGSYRVRRYWLSGPNAGTAETFVENLPGFPDNVTRASGGIFWLAIPAPRNDLIDRLAGQPTLRRVVLRLPEALRPEPDRYGMILGLDEEGNVAHNLQDPDGDVAFVASAMEHDGRLFLGTYQDPAVRIASSPR